MPAEPLILEDGHRPAIESLQLAAEGSLHPGLLRPGDAAVFASITIIGGAYHEVRRIFAALGSHVLALCRVRFGLMDLPIDLQPGRYRAVAIADVWPARASTEDHS
jgi:16S rRNA pseudouridine516 synthase